MTKEEFDKFNCSGETNKLLEQSENNAFNIDNVKNLLSIRSTLGVENNINKFYNYLCKEHEVKNLFGVIKYNNIYYPSNYIKLLSNSEFENEENTEKELSIYNDWFLKGYNDFHELNMPDKDIFDFVVNFNYRHLPFFIIDNKLDIPHLHDYGKDIGMYYAAWCYILTNQSRFEKLFAELYDKNTILFIDETAKQTQEYQCLESSISRNGYFEMTVEFDSGSESVKLFNPSLAYMLCSNNLSAKNQITGEDIQLGYEDTYKYCKTYAIAFKKGEQEFDEAFRSPIRKCSLEECANTLYNTLYKKVNRSFDTVCFDSINQPPQLILNHKIIEQYGYCSGLINQMDKLRGFVTSSNEPTSTQPKPKETDINIIIETIIPKYVQENDKDKLTDLLEKNNAIDKINWLGSHDSLVLTVNEWQDNKIVKFLKGQDTKDFCLSHFTIKNKK